AGAGRPRLLQLPRRADQQPCAGMLPRPGRPPMVAGPASAQPESGRRLAPQDEEADRRLAPKAANPPPVARAAQCRHIPEVGAVCGKAARTDLRGGRPAMGVPTATGATCPYANRSTAKGARSKPWLRPAARSA